MNLNKLLWHLQSFFTLNVLTAHPNWTPPIHSSYSTHTCKPIIVRMHFPYLLSRCTVSLLPTEGSKAPMVNNKSHPWWSYRWNVLNAATEMTRVISFLVCEKSSRCVLYVEISLLCSALGRGSGPVCWGLGCYLYLGPWTTVSSEVSGSKSLCPNWQVSGKDLSCSMQCTQCCLHPKVTVMSMTCYSHPCSYCVFFFFTCNLLVCAHTGSASRYRLMGWVPLTLPMALLPLLI